MGDSPKDEDAKLQNFDEIVEWCRSNGFTDFDFEGLERRVLELARALRPSNEHPDRLSETNEGEQPPGKLIPFKKIPPRRDS